MDRKALRRDAAGVTVLHEQRIPLEEDLQAALVAHPDALPAEDLGLGPLVSLSWELDLGAGPMDHLAVDPHGQLVIVEYKKGTENPDVRRVIAQLLDYGSALWRRSVEELDQRCGENGEHSLIGSGTSIADHVAAAVADEAFDGDRFNEALRTCLENGSFVFLYIARDLDARTRRVLTFLAEALSLRFYAIEVDWFAAADGSAVLVPRIAYVPAAIAAGPTPTAPSDPAIDELIARVGALAHEAGLAGTRAETGRSWGRGAIVGIYRTSRGFSIALPLVDQLLGAEVRDQTRSEFEAIFPERKLAAAYPYVPPSAVLERWTRVEQLLRPLFASITGAERALPG